MDYSIAEISKITGLSAYTLRYYENIGLLSDIERDENGYRRYADKDILWIDFLIRLRNTGMPIGQMQKFAQLRRQGNSTAGARRALLETHQDHVLNEIKELEQHAAVIREKIVYYKQLEEES
ncbi:MerR family transcriptional regulator [Paenibacillus radicis (ex Gao et al. 2016)]|uniref:MerR family transcriptional regulator n=1 Tax=Paenibacillus radicis (ex Gao et al. 2016) TaxID=1737354 RepID=A0A917H675_9BACL|nr:MerR family transcriptional regulator [Paenibacillus radicis (ex Gao et al. 2016)]GGG68928.1 MerR family transcriptional regulator [Paenibacillus radicis (ex Gao et al. 2016)]